MKTWQRSLLIVTGLLFVGTAVAYAQLPEPKVHEFPYLGNRGAVWIVAQLHILFAAFILGAPIFVDRKSTRLNSSHLVISYAVFCLKKKKKTISYQTITKTNMN